ncbi:MAG: hypothetical protein QM489_00760 [Candidatus Izemoplasma sp.]
MNQITQLNNVFGHLPSARLLFFYYDISYHNSIKTLLAHLGTLPKKIPETDIPALVDDANMIKLLREL